MQNIFLNRMFVTLTCVCLVHGPLAWAQDSPMPAQEDVVGVVAEQPAEGRFVRAGNQFMVPYDQRLPGSEIFIRMQPVPGGKLEVTSKPRDGKPSQVVVYDVAPFWMAEHEVSWKQYAEFTQLYTAIKKVARSEGDEEQDSVDAVSTPTELYDPSFYFSHSRSPNQPATGMTQFAARQFTKWLSLRTGVQYRLPGEEEWTYACVGGQSQQLEKKLDYKQLKEIACIDNLPNGASIVGSFKANAFELHDMLGNVSEWVISTGKHDVASKCGLVSTREMPEDSRFGQLVCGGSWIDHASECQPLSRFVCSEDWWEEDPDIPVSPHWLLNLDYSVTVGFRICRPFREVPRDEMQAYWEADSEDLVFDVKMRVDGGRGARAPISDEIQRYANENGSSFLKKWLNTPPR